MGLVLLLDEDIDPPAARGVAPLVGVGCGDAKGDPYRWVPEMTFVPPHLQRQPSMRATSNETMSVES